MRRRPLVVSVLAVAAAGGLLLLAAGQRWGAAMVTSGTGRRVHVTVTGRDVAPSLPAVGLALLALAVAVLAARGLLRRVVGLLVVVAGATGLSVAVAARRDVGSAVLRHAFAPQEASLRVPAATWWVVAAIAGAVAAAAGIGVVVRGAAWSGLGARYDAPGPSDSPSGTAEKARAVDPVADAWQALDRGEDPTD